MQVRLRFGRWPGKVSRALPAAEETNKKEKKYMMTMLSRRDRHVGAGEFDSIKWAFETHVGKPDDPAYNYAVLYGNEDAPDRIDFWAREPQEGVMPRLIWRATTRHTFEQARTKGRRV
jgi:hypothetical protein